MQNGFILKGMNVYSEHSVLNQGYVVVEEEKIVEVGSADSFQQSVYQGFPVLELPSHFSLIPGMIDLHIHGAAGADVMDATEAALIQIAQALPAEGTTSFLATTMTQEEPFIEQALQNVFRYMDRSQSGKAEILGIHLEGPFLSEKRAGAQPIQAIIAPNLSLFQKWQSLANGQIKLVTLAPEKEHALQLIQYLKKTGVVASMGHSDATYEEAAEGIRAGIGHVTHLFNGMSGLHHREPGVAAAALLHPEVVVELIVDGIHIHPQMVKLTFQNKGSDGIILVTDAMCAKCLRDGTYHLGGQEVKVRGSKATLENGTLAGSLLLMKEAVKNMIHFTNCSLRDTIKMASENPAKQIGVFDRKGSISVGKDADLVILNEYHDVIMTFCRGKRAYSHAGGIL